ncbi:Gti1/Pac2 family-domain-containing protein [Gautieria morchelliformis]|nr:Gti1/Pac2 family-domain-containing protein [Gautieria morchelliformis]
MSYPAPPNNNRATGRHTTHPCLHIRNAADAHVVFEAVRLNILPMIRRRLGPTERDILRSGEIFVWEETDQKGGLERWTDGRRWSQSRMREPFLYYEEKEPTTKEEKEAKAARRAYRHADPSAPPPSPSRRQDRPSKSDGLTKQTYSIYVNLGNCSRKWHLVAYFCGSDYTRLPVVEDYDYLRRIRIPNGVYVSAKGVHQDVDNEEEDRYLQSGSSRSPPAYGPVPSATASYFFSTTSSHAHADRSQSSHLPSSRLRPSGHVFASYASAEGPQYMTPHAHVPQTARFPNPNHTRQSSQSSYTSDSKPYIPLTQEDKRALGAFRVAL